MHDDGRVDIASSDETAAQKAVAIIKELTAEAELGKTYLGKVVRVVNFGAFVEILPGVEGLVHISELSHKRVARVSDVVKEGDEIEAVVLSVDPKARRISLSMKNVNAPPEPEAPPQAAAQEPPAKAKPAKQPTKPLLGGLGRSPRGSRSGLKW